MPPRLPNPAQPDRATTALRSVLPPSVGCQILAASEGADVIVNGIRLELKWAGEGNLGDVDRVLRGAGKPDVVAARQLSPGARERLSAAHVGWVDETGAAEIAVAGIVVSRTGRPQSTPKRAPGWTPAALAVAEALLCGTPATVKSAVAATGLSTGSCTAALLLFRSLDLLTAGAPRGRASGRNVRSPGALLAAYAGAATALRPSLSLPVGVLWREPVRGLGELGGKLNAAKLRWAATGTLAAQLLAPHLTEVGTVELYVEASTTASLEAVAAAVGLKPMPGGRLLLRPPPSVGALGLAREVDGLPLAPWPRVYADLRTVGVRGEEAAEHLAEVMLARGA